MLSSLRRRARIAAINMMTFTRVRRRGGFVIDRIEAPEVSTKPRKRISWRWWIAGGAVGGVLALILGGIALGWWAANQTLIASQQNSTEAPDAAPVIALESSMPDVRGLTQDEAAQVLADSGFAATIITFEDAPSGLPEGTVVMQSPVFGTAAPDAIVIGIATSTTMPPLTGADRQEAVATLSDLGVAVTVVFQYDAKATIGTVLSTSPAAGQPLGDTATVTLTTPGSSIALGELRRLDGDCRPTRQVVLRGTEYPSAVQCHADSEMSTTTWALGAKGDLFTATAGIDDDETPGTSATIELLADGAVIKTEKVAFGEPVKISSPMTGVIQLSVRVSAPAEVEIVLAGASIAGADAAIAELEQ